MGGGIGSILYSDRGTTREHFTYNAVGHTVALTLQSGAVAKTDLYEAFGGIVASTGQSANNRLANTKERSFTLSLDNHGFRYYDPEVGRYLTRDPIGYADGLNVYLYVHNNPINHIDPLGLSGQKVEGSSDNDPVDRRLDEITTAADARAMLLEENPEAKKTVEHYREAGSLVSDVAEEIAGAHPVVSVVEGVTGESAAGRRELTKWERGVAVGAAVVSPATRLLGRLKGLVKRGGKAPDAAKALPGRSGAFRSAKEAAGVPRSAQPSRVYHERIYDQPGNVQGRVYEFTKPDGSVVTIREHSLGHVKGGHGPHFNVEIRPPGGGPKQPLPGGGDGHFYFEP
jgi:RHS repeat-associated protein